MSRSNDLVSNNRPKSLIFSYLAGIMWLMLPFYNDFILSKCSGDCSIRVDLLFVIPLLIVVTIKGLLQIWHHYLSKVNRGK